MTPTSERLITLVDYLEKNVGTPLHAMRKVKIELRAMAESEKLAEAETSLRSIMRLADANKRAATAQRERDEARAKLRALVEAATTACDVWDANCERDDPPSLNMAGPLRMVRALASVEGEAGG